MHAAYSSLKKLVDLPVALVMINKNAKLLLEILFISTVSKRKVPQNYGWYLTSFEFIALLWNTALSKTIKHQIDFKC